MSPEFRQRLVKGNLPFLLLCCGLATIWFAYDSGSDPLMFSGSMILIVAYTWVNGNYLYR